MKDIVGVALTLLNFLVSVVVFLVAYQLYGRHPALDHFVLLCFVLGHTYSALTILIGAALPLWVVYSYSDVIEMMHRSRYLMFDCVALPCVIWLIATTLHRRRDDLGFAESAAGLFDEPLRWVSFSIIGAVHLGLSGLAAPDCSRYPMSADNCLGVGYWRPARFTKKMRYPLLCTIRGMCLLGVFLLYSQKRPWLLFAVASLRLAFHGHMTDYKYFTWEIFVQPLAAAAISAAFLDAMEIGVHCDWRTLDPTHCLVSTPKGAVPLLGGASRLRF